MEENKNLENLEEATVVETPVQETIEPASEPVVETQKVDEGKMKIAKNFFAISVFLLVLMSFRLLTSLLSIEDVFLLLGQADADYKLIGIISLIELIFMVANLGVAIVLFIYSNKYKKSVQNCEAQFAGAKTFKLITLITAILYTIFVVFEIVAIVKLSIIVASLEIEMTVSYASIVWSAVYALGLFGEFIFYKKRIIYKKIKCFFLIFQDKKHNLRVVFLLSIFA